MNDKALQARQMWFVNQRLGQFIHFNSATQQFYNHPEIEDWEYGHENDQKPRRFPFDPLDWNPTALDCRQWAAISKSLGAKFAALTTKHHEGFCLWPTETTEHCVRNATCKRDVVAEYLAAYRDAGIEAGLYFSILDLTRGIGRRRCTQEDVDYTLAQLRELLTNYGQIPFLIIDGWNADWGGPSYEAMPFEKVDALVKSLQPECLLMNISCESNLSHTDIVFYENAAGQEVEDGFFGPGAACNILTNTWFWREGDAEMELKSVDWALDKIDSMNQKNISFILNISPNRFGVVDQNLADRMAEIGRRFQPLPPLTEAPAGFMVR